MFYPEQCPFHRSSDNVSVGRGIGYCNLDCTQTICDGDVDFCENPGFLKRYLLEEKKNEIQNPGRALILSL